MIDCAFACETPKGTLCNYMNAPCYSKNGWECSIMQNAVREFEELLNNSREDEYSEEFMERAVRKYRV